VKNGSGDKCKIEESKRGKKGRKEVERARTGLLCQGFGGRGYVIVYWGANPEAAKLTTSSNSQVRRLQDNLLNLYSESLLLITPEISFEISL
jgi:hypothetical protein